MRISEVKYEIHIFFMGKRRIYSLLFALILQITLIGIMDMYGQTIYKKANGKTYVFDNGKKRVYKQSYVNKLVQRVETEGFDVENYTLVSETFKKILSAERIKEHQKDMVAVSFECSVNGKIESVKFVFAKAPFLTVEEIEKLESSFLNQSFKINSRLDEGTKIGFTIPCFFSRIQN